MATANERLGCPSGSEVAARLTFEMSTPCNPSPSSDSADQGMASTIHIGVFVIAVQAEHGSQLGRLIQRISPDHAKSA
jgi:hypothetical protein